MKKAQTLPSRLQHVSSGTSLGTRWEPVSHLPILLFPPSRTGERARRRAEPSDIHDGCGSLPSFSKPIAHGLPMAAGLLYCFRLRKRSAELEQIWNGPRLASSLPKSGLTA